MADYTTWHYVWYRVDEERRKRGWSWRELCTRSGVKMSSWMSGVGFARPSEEELRKVANTMDLSYDYLRYGSPGWEPS